MKGLEFDAVVVVEPAAIAELDAGLLRLYVAMTRPVQHLGIVHAPAAPSLVAAAEEQRAPRSLIAQICCHNPRCSSPPSRPLQLRVDRRAGQRLDRPGRRRRRDARHRPVPPP
ncbi:MAG: hypothetical protein R2710_15785 [Acidimicrobiales bacterium]